MPPNPTTPNLDARMSRVELAVQRLEDQVAQLVKEFGEYKDRMDAIIEDHQTALYGDKGKPGLVGQAGTLEELRVALKGYGKEPGLIAEIQELRQKMADWNDGRKWMTRLVLGTVLTDVILNIIKIME